MKAHACVAAWVCALLGAQEPPPAFVEVVPAASTVWLHEPCEVLVRIGIDAAWFVASAVPLFQQRLDYPFQLEVPWLLGAEDRAVEFVPPTAATAGSRIAIGDRVVTAVAAGQRQQGGRTFDLLELRYRWLPLASGVSAIAPVELRYAFATRFAEDFLRGRQPLDRQEQSVSSAASTLTVRALPAAGRPPGFAGAVGEFTLSAKAAVTEVRVGDSFSLAVVVAGPGNLDRFPPMAWPVLPGFHVQGLVERREPGVRTFVFDVLALRAGVQQVPAVPFVAFAPKVGAYVQLAAGPVPLQIAAAAPGTVLPARIRELVDADARAVRGSMPWWAYAVAVGAVTASWQVYRSRRRRAVRDEAMREAVARLGKAGAAGPSAMLPAYEALLARCVGEDEFSAAVWTRLEQVCTSAELVAGARRMHAALDEARYGGRVSEVDDVLRLVIYLRTHCPPAPR